MSNVKLTEFGKDFQDQVMQAIMFDKPFAEQLIEVLDPQYFDQKYLQFLSNEYLNYYKKYRDFPSLKLLKGIIKEELEKDEPLKNQVVNYLVSIKKNPNPGDLPFVKEKILDFCKKQSLKAALLAAAEQLETGRYDTIAQDIRKAAMVGMAANLGHDFFDDIEARFNTIKRNCIPTGLDPLDAVLNGGLGAGELACIVAGTGGGKSHFMVMLGAEAMLQGKNVLHYTFELSETNTGLRYDSYFTHVNSDQVVNNKDVVRDYYKANRANLGALKIKEFPPNSATINTIRTHMERLALSGFVPDMIIFDYADLMRSSRQYESPRHELKLLYEELRALAVEHKVCVITASQSNKEGTNSDVIDVSNVNESFGKAFTCDILLTLSRKTAEKAAGTGRLLVGKNRAGRDGICFNVTIDTAQSRFEISGEFDMSQPAMTPDLNEQKKRLAAAWNEHKTSTDFKLEHMGHVV